MFKNWNAVIYEWPLDIMRVGENSHKGDFRNSGSQFHRDTEECFENSPSNIIFYQKFCVHLKFAL